MPSANLTTVTLGCKVNQYETEYVRQGLLGIGFRDTLPDETADLCIVNTCTVTGEGDAKSRQTIRQLARRNPQARIIVMGCYATRAPDEVARLPGVVEVVTDKRELADLLSRHGVRDIPTGISTFQTGRRRRAFVKVQDGCLLDCSYCIIPRVRPHLASRPPEHILEEVRRLVGNGYREIVLTGIHLGHYGVEQNAGKPKRDWLRLSHLLERIVALDGAFRVRLSSIEATEVTLELVDVLAAHPERICPHLHISMQSGSDRVLARMRRRWGSRRFVDRCRLLAERLDRPAFSTDVIVGFPGETEADFQETLAACREVGFSKIHAFPFSARPGTDATTYPDQVPPEVKHDRLARLAACETELRSAYFAGLLGRNLSVLVEAPPADRPGIAQGTSCRFAPVEFPGGIELDGRLVSVRIEGALEDRLTGRALGQEAETLPSGEVTMGDSPASHGVDEVVVSVTSSPSA
jgi:threonylcarbamoyladenosine tRNA methylthiotransferase MtaB